MYFIITTIIIIMPLLGLGAINIGIVAGTSKKTSSIKCSGRHSHILTTVEAQSCGLHSDHLQDILEGLLGNRPHDVFMHSPTPNVGAPKDDLYLEFGWPEVTAHYSCSSAEIVDFSSTQMLLSEQKLHNSKKHISSYTFHFDQHVNEIIQISWNKDSKLEADFPLEYTVNSIETPTMLSYLGNWGKNTSIDKMTTFGTSSSAEVPLLPDEIAVASLTAFQIILTFKIVYETNLDGYLAMNFPKQYKGHHYYASDINAFMTKVGLQKTHNTTSFVKVAYFTLPSMEVLQIETIYD